jgi:hypothetical protein
VTDQNRILWQNIRQGDHDVFAATLSRLPETIWEIVSITEATCGAQEASRGSAEKAE